MDQIFGEANRIGIINWQKTYSAKKTKHLSTATEYILVYAKRLDQTVTRLIDRDDAMNARYPAWVLGSDTRKVHRYSTSRGFWSGPDGAGRDPRGGVPAPIGPDQDDHGDVNNDETPPVRRTIAQQLESCGQATVILREVDEADEATGEVTVRRQFLHKICEPLLDFIKRVGCIEVNGRSTRAVLAANLPWLSHASSAVT